MFLNVTGMIYLFTLILFSMVSSRLIWFSMCLIIITLAARKVFCNDFKNVWKVNQKHFCDNFKIIEIDSETYHCIYFYKNDISEMYSVLISKVFEMFHRDISVMISKVFEYITEIISSRKWLFLFNDFRCVRNVFWNDFKSVWTR